MIKNFDLKGNIIEFLQSIVIAIAICIVIYIFIATPNQIEGLSMNPTFENGEIVLTSKVHQWLGGTPFGEGIGIKYNRGDIVVFQKPGFDDFIKRIIAIPGDTIALKAGQIYINGQLIKEDYLSEGTYTKGGSFIQENGSEKKLGEGEYFLMGDNRNNSHDSRYSDIGLIKRDWLKGKVLIRYLPINKVTVMNHGYTFVN